MTGSTVLIIAGEKSGDNYGAALVRRFRDLAPSTSFFGVGGSALAAEGVERLFPLEDLALMGLLEVVRHLPRLRRMFNRLEDAVRTRKPRAAVLIDSPDFNLRLAKRLHKLGVPVLYYISPTVWAWRPGRLKTIAKFVDKMLLIFPFEKAIYEKAGLPARFVGHPLIERVRVGNGREAFCRAWGLDPERPIIALMPGSRRGEVANHMPVLMAAVPRIRTVPESQFILIKAEDLDGSFLQGFIPKDGAAIKILDRDSYDAMAAADLVLSACGTANLEAAILGTPAIAFYRMAPLTYWLGRNLVKIRVFSIVNILAGEKLVPELIQKEFNADRLAQEAGRLMSSPDDRSRLRRRFVEIKDGLGSEPASINAAQELYALLTGARRSGPSEGIPSSARPKRR